mgnify:CR=1 FL=1
MRRIAKMPLWAESRIHGDVYVRFGGRLSETYHRKVAWRRQPSLQVTDRKVDEDMKRLKEQTKGRKINLYEEDEPETADIITVNG